MTEGRTSVLLVARFDDPDHSHSQQRARAAERLGYDVSPFDLDKRPGLLGRLTGADLERRLAKAIPESEANLVVVIGGYEIDSSIIASLKTASGIPWANWFPDDLSRIDDIAAVASAYDRVFVIGTDVADVLERRLGRAVEVLPPAADPSVFRPIRTKDQYRANVVFAGSATPAREAYLVGLLEFGIAVWGPGWRRTSLKDYCRGEVRNTSEFIRAYGGASVAVNLHRDLGLTSTEPRATCNQRVFEIAAMGLPQVVDERADLSRWFEPGRHMLTFRTADELKRGVEQLLHDPTRAETMAAEARNELLARHTYMHRMKRVLE